MRVDLFLSGVLVGLPAVLATPARGPAAVSQGSAFAYIPAAIEKAYQYGHEIAQWALGKNEKTVQVHELGFVTQDWPHHPHHPHERVVVNKTIYEVLSGEPRFSKLFKLVNLNNATIDLLNDTSSNITFFAPPDSAFPKPRHGRHHPNTVSSKSDDMFQEFEDPAESSWMDILDEVDSLDALDEDEDRKERRRKIIKHIVDAVLSYHVIPTSFDATTLAKNVTYGTNLTLPDGSLDGESLRVRVGRGPITSSLTVNLFSRVVGPEIVTSNGIVHAVSLPLLPPPAIFTGQFNVPSVFSIATSALQRVGLADEVDYVPHHGDKEGRIIGSGTVTFFAPSNQAFHRIPARLRLFLFSPFGHRALKKLLQYHIVPSHAVHSDYIHNATDSSSMQHLAADFVRVPERGVMIARYETIVRHHPVAHTIPTPTPERLSLLPTHSGPAGRSLLRAGFSDRCLQAPIPAKLVETPRHRPAPPKVEYNTTIVVPTLLENHTHTIVVTKFAERKIIPGFPHPPLSGAQRTTVTVSGRGVALVDVPARNGAVHVIDHLLNPLRDHKHGHEQDCEFQMGGNEWDDWEDWLPRWAEEA